MGVSVSQGLSEFSGVSRNQGLTMGNGVSDNGISGGVQFPNGDFLLMPSGSNLQFPNT